jgi:CspA family cold shock protein
MSISGKVVIATVIGIVAAIIAGLLQGGGLPQLGLVLLFLLATIGTALATHRPLAAPPAPAGAAPAAGAAAATADAPARSDRAPRREQRPAPAAAAAPAGPRAQGSVKWFNASKGFGFITLDDGREIFVHFRSIRGEGRRSLRDGQRVDFVVADTDKGPQAEDVQPLD